MTAAFFMIETTGWIIFIANLLYFAWAFMQIYFDVRRDTQTRQEGGDRKE